MRGWVDGRPYEPAHVERELMSWYTNIHLILRRPSNGDAWIDFFAATLP